VEERLRSIPADRPDAAPARDHSRENVVALDELVAQRGKNMQPDQCVGDFCEQMMRLDGCAIGAKLPVERQGADDGDIGPMHHAIEDGGNRRIGG
jgi:hypothetical protein